MQWVRPSPGSSLVSFHHNGFSSGLKRTPSISPTTRTGIATNKWGYCNRRTDSLDKDPKGRFITNQCRFLLTVPPDVPKDVQRLDRKEYTA
ncbi:hypothetical protein [Larkinella harenae]